MKPLTLEEAKANIGKEVVYIGEHISAKKDFANHEATIAKVLPNSDFVDVRMKKRGVSILTWRVGINDLSLKQPLKIGDTVKLDPSTKPYTWVNVNGDVVEKEDQNPRAEFFKVTHIHEDGEIELGSVGWIAPRHLIKVEEKAMAIGQLIKRNTVQDATYIGIKSKLFSTVAYETRFLWINNQWIECHSIDDDFEPVTIGIDTGEDKVEHKPQYSEEEVELRERIAFKLLEVDKYTYPDLCAVYNAITGK